MKKKTILKAIRKPPKPSYLLSTVDINSVLTQYQNEDFYFLGVTPLDGYKNWSKYLKPIKKYRYLAIVINTDTHEKPGKHWVAFFIDYEDKKIFYFDSLQNPMPKEMGKYIDIFSKKLGKLNGQYKITKVQKDDINCGLHVIHFIVSQLRKTKKSPTRSMYFSSTS